MLMFLLNKIYGVDEKRVVFISQGGKSYSCNPRAISEKLHDSSVDYKIIWLLIDPVRVTNILPKYVISIPKRSFRALKALSTSKVWVSNHEMPNYVYKGSDQVYIQTWHGDRGFKKVLYDIPRRSNSFQLLEAKILNVLVVGSNYGEKNLKSAFNFSGSVLNAGCPRNDMLINGTRDQVNYFKTKNNIEPGTMILTYAPTFRDELTLKKTKQTMYGIDLIKIVQTLEAKHNSKWVCYIRSHQLSDGIVVDGLPGEVFLNGNQIEDMNELLLISDMLITDYSSSAGDFILMNKPVILYQQDQDSYSKKNRGFYFNPDDSPFLIAKNNKELIDIVKDLDQETILRNCNEVLAFYGAYESGTASKEVVEYIINQ